MSEVARSARRNIAPYHFFPGSILKTQPSTLRDFDLSDDRPVVAHEGLSNDLGEARSRRTGEYVVYFRWALRIPVEIIEGPFLVTKVSIACLLR